MTLDHRSTTPAGKGEASRAYGRPPLLVGYTYDPEDAWAARDAGRLLAIRIETNRTCNLRCRYCYAESGARQRQNVPVEALLDLVDQAADLGAESVVVIGGGEPTLHPRFRRLIDGIADRRLVPMIFSNCIAIDAEMAAFLQDCRASVMTKLDSLIPEVQDYLAGVPGAAGKIRAGIDNLLEAGLGDTDDPRRLRLGASFVSCRLNVDEIESIWHWCRTHHVFPNMEVLTPTGRAKEELPGQGLELEEIRDYKLRLLEIDRRDYGYDWLPYTPLTASGCLQHLYSLYVTFAGDVRPCAPTKFDQHPAFRRYGPYPYNIHAQTLAEIYGSPLFWYVRHIEEHLEGRCRACPEQTECIGCRGYAYSVGVNEGKAPLDALRGECLQCWRPQ